MATVFTRGRVTRRSALRLAALSALPLLAAACGQAATPTTAPAKPTEAAKPAATTAPSAPAATQPAAAGTSTVGGAATPAAGATTAAGATPAAAAPAKPSGPVTLTFYSGGDTNIRDLWQNDLLPMYKKANPQVSFDFVFSEHGTTNQATFDKLAAAKKAGKPSGIDLWEQDTLLQQGGEGGFIEKIDATKVPNFAKTDQSVDGRIGNYGVPYRASSVILAYNSKDVAQPPKTIDALITWIKQNPEKFTYNPPDTGGSGSAFVQRVLKIGIDPKDEQLFETGYDQSKEVEWDKGWGILKDIHPYTYGKGNYPKGNVPVLQALGKGSVSVAPVWSDQSLSYLNQKLLPPEVKLMQIDPPFNGGASYVGVIADSEKKAAAFAFLDWLLTPEPQQVIIDKLQGYPGLDWKYMPPAVQEKYQDIAKAYSFGFSSKFSNDMNQQWYEKVAGTPPPTKSP
jgi:putative spermidine/putrescine transport system substrate-binding protein